MDSSAVERADQGTGVDEQAPRVPRKTIDPDAALVAQLRRADAGAVEALVGVYGDRVYRLAISITANAADEKRRGRRSRRHEVSWEDAGPSFDDNRRHAEVAVDWSWRLKHLL